MDLQADIAEDASSGVNRHMPSDFDCGPINLGKTQLSHSLGLGCNLPPALHPNLTLALNSNLPYGANSLMGPGTASRCGRRKDSTPHALLPGRVSLVSLHPQLSWTRVCSFQCHASFGTAMPGLPGAARSLWGGFPTPLSGSPSAGRGESHAVVGGPPCPLLSLLPFLLHRHRLRTLPTLPALSPCW